MPQYSFTVNTEPMANAVDNVSHKLNQTTAAVVAMQAAVIASEKSAADTICKNVDMGFLSLMQSQLSTKKAQYLSEMSAKMLNLMELSKALSSKEDRMEVDVERLHGQYYTTFHSLDRALENRIQQLDRDAMQLGNVRKDLIMSCQLKEAGVATVSNREASNTAQLALTARIKSKTSRAISNMANNVAENEQYRQQVQSVLEQENVMQPARECIPVICVQEASMVMKDSSVSQVITPDTLNNATGSAIENSLNQHMDVLLGATKTQYEQGEIDREFRNMTVNAGLNPRVSQLMLQLYEIGGRR